MDSREEAEAVAFVRTLKQNLPNFESLSEALKAFRDGKTEPAALVSKVSEILRGHRDLVVGFNNFLPENHKLPVPSADEPTQNFAVDIPTTSQPQLSLKRRKQVLKEAVEFVNKVRKISKDDDVYASFLRAVTDFEAHRDILRVDKEISALFKDNPESYIGFTWFAADDNYCRNLDVPVSSPRKLTTLEECEDKLYESDMIFHSLESTKKATEKLLKETRENNGNGDGGIKVEDYFSAQNLRCIKEMYVEEHGDEMIELLQTNPTAAACVLLRRLNQKLEEAGVWREGIREQCIQTMRRERNTINNNE